MKKVLVSIFTITVIGLFLSCSSDNNDIIPTDDGDQEVNTKLTGQITEDKTLTNDEIWEIEGRVTVTSFLPGLKVLLSSCCSLLGNLTSNILILS